MASFLIGQHSFTAAKPVAGLYIVATPIGNLGDITLRALEVLAGADIVACEDTRVTSKLLNRYGIKARKRAYHEHNADEAGPKLLAAISEGKVVALASDAGTPLISDPGQRLVAEAREMGLPVFPIPGASAPLAALTASGFATDQFTFAGFLPSKKGARIAALETLRSASGTLVYFEGPSRLAASLGDMADVFGPDRQAAVCRELTKMHEEVRRGGLAELAQYYETNPPKGEIVVVIAPVTGDNNPLDPDALLLELMQTMALSAAAAEAAKLTGISKRDLYQRALQIQVKLDLQEKP